MPAPAYGSVVYCYPYDGERTSEYITIKILMPKLPERRASHGLEDTRRLVDARTSLLKFDKELMTLHLSGDYKGAMEYIKKHWTGPYPAIGGDPSRGVQVAHVVDLLEKTYRRCEYILAMYCEKFFDEWFDPEICSAHQYYWLMQNSHIPKEKWEPYLAARLLQEPGLTVKGYIPPATTDRFSDICRTYRI